MGGERFLQEGQPLQEKLGFGKIAKNTLAMPGLTCWQDKDEMMPIIQMMSITQRKMPISSQIDRLEHKGKMISQLKPRDGWKPKDSEEARVIQLQEEGKIKN